MPRKPLPLSKGFDEETATIQRIHRKVVEDTSIPPPAREELLVNLARIVTILNEEAVRRARERDKHSQAQAG